MCSAEKQSAAHSQISFTFFFGLFCCRLRQGKPADRAKISIRLRPYDRTSREREDTCGSGKQTSWKSSNLWLSALHAGHVSVDCSCPLNRLVTPLELRLQLSAQACCDSSCTLPCSPSCLYLALSVISFISSCGAIANFVLIALSRQPHDAWCEEASCTVKCSVVTTASCSALCAVAETCSDLLLSMHHCTGLSGPRHAADVSHNSQDTVRL